MKEMWIIIINHVHWNGDVSEEIPFIYGKNDTAIRAEKVTDSWLAQNAYCSIAAAKRGLSAIPWRKNNPCGTYGAAIESVLVPEGKFHYRLFRCYEIVVVDENGNQVGETRHCYGSKSEAEAIGEQEVAWAEADNASECT